jgi:hypothetical protein
MRENFTGPHTRHKATYFRRMFKTADFLTRPTLACRGAPSPKQGRSERRGEEVHTALRVGRSPFELILANGKFPPVLPTSESLSSVR